MEKFPRPSDPLCKDLFEVSLPFLEGRAQELKIEGLSRSFFQETIVPIGVYLNLFHQRNTPYLICLTGGQGSGKTTLSNFIQLFLEKVCRRTSVGFSIDDLYKTK